MLECLEWGIVQPRAKLAWQQVDDLTAMGQEVFRLPLEEKEAYSTEKYLPSRLLGYLPILRATWSHMLTSSPVTNELDVQWDHLQRRKMAMKASLRSYRIIMAEWRESLTEDCATMPRMLIKYIPTTTGFERNLRESIGFATR